jgi:glutamate transport system permease protein
VSGIAILAILLLALAGGSALHGHGQFDWSLWAPLVDPGDQQFAAVWAFLGEGLLNSGKITVLAMAFSMPAGTLLALIGLLSGRWISRAVLTMIELVRAIPVVILIFFVSVILPQQGLRLHVLWYMVIALTLHNAAVMAVIVRAGVSALPRGQVEAAYALGLSRLGSLRWVLLPQALRLMLPALITQLVMVVKESTLGFIVSFPDFLKAAQIAVQSLHNPLQMYFLVGLVFVAINFALSALASRLGRSPSVRAPIHRQRFKAPISSTAGGSG